MKIDFIPVVNNRLAPQDAIVASSDMDVDMAVDAGFNSAGQFSASRTAPLPPSEQVYVPPLPVEQSFVPPPPAERPYVPPPTPAPKPHASPSSLQMKDRLEQALQISFVDLFAWNQDESSAVMLERRAMLLFHPVHHAEEVEIITRWLLMHHVEVSSAWHEGSWVYFRQQITEERSGVILVSDC